MSKNCNGAYSEKFTKTNGLVGDKEKRQSFDLSDAGAENFPPHEAFRGFEKVPVVLLRRLDITPYLNPKSCPKIGGNPTDVDTGKHLKRALQVCKVNLVKDDLDKLLMSLNTVKDYSSGSDTSAMQDNMAVKCKICEKVYSSEKRLQNHQQNKHMIIYKPNLKPQKRVSFCDRVIVHEVKEYHKCRKCTKIFENYKLLKLHMKQRHKKRKCYICNYCNKNFIDRMFFKVHIKLHCDMCGLLFPTKAKYIEHRHNVCRVLKKHRCKVCDITFFKLMALKDHSYEHLTTYYICDVCKDQFQTKCALSHHLSFLHSQQRPSSLYGMRNLGNERLYLCNFCDESSVERDVIERHVQTLPDLTNKAMTGYKDYYFCDQCSKKFNCETDMLHHKWSHFLKTSDNSQIRPKSILTKKKTMKMTYKCNEEIPEYMKPNVVVEKLPIDTTVVEKKVEYQNVNSIDYATGNIKKAAVDPKSRKTIVSKHQCQQCAKYFSSIYTLNRHIETLHSDYVNLRCHVCEETFVWPSLLRSHKCIRLNIPEMPFDDARPEIHFDNLNEITPNGFDISESDYINSIDFEIPAPIVELTEYDSLQTSDSGLNIVDKNCGLGIGYKLIMQEVPIEF